MLPEHASGLLTYRSLMVTDRSSRGTLDLRGFRGHMDGLGSFPLRVTSLSEQRPLDEARETMHTADEVHLREELGINLKREQLDGLGDLLLSAPRRALLPARSGKLSPKGVFDEAAELARPANTIHLGQRPRTDLDREPLEWRSESPLVHDHGSQPADSTLPLSMGGAPDGLRLPRADAGIAG